MFNYKGPMLFGAERDLRPDHKTGHGDRSRSTPWLSRCAPNPVDQKTLDRALVKLRSSLYDTMGEFGGFGLMDLLASFALFDDDPARVNSLVAQFDKVTPELVQKTAQEYLRPATARSWKLQPAPKPAAGAGEEPVGKEKSMNAHQ